MNEGSKYYSLYLHLRQSGQDELTLTLAEIEALIGEVLPKTAQSQRSWWSNRSRGAVQAAAWMGAGYHVEKMDFEAGQITFRKPGKVYHVERDGDAILWNASMIKALRHHMRMNQAEFALELGVRQPTISEWETGVYIPKRSSSKLLTFVAERAGFTYNDQ